MNSNNLKKHKISGMTCSGCSGRVKKILEKHEGVISATVDHVTGEAEIHGTISEPQVKQIVENAGYVYDGNIV